MALHRKKSLEDIVNQSGKILENLKARGESSDSSRTMRVINAANKYMDNISNSNVLNNIEKRDRAKNNGLMTAKGIEKQYTAKVARSTYMGLNEG